jgi:hypothetical protein
MSDPFHTYGQPELCCWCYLPGTCRFQTTDPDFARKLSQRRGARLVAWSVNRGYLRVFEERIEPWRARQLVTRYLTPTNEAFFDPIPPLNRFPELVKVLSAENTRRHDNSRSRLKITDFPQLKSMKGYR